MTPQVLFVTNHSVLEPRTLSPLYRSPQERRGTQALRHSGKKFEGEMKLINLLLRLVSLILPLATSSAELPRSTPTPLPWPEQFHSILLLSFNSNRLQINDLWYDWPKGRNVNIIQRQLGELQYDIEWNNGTSFYYTVGAGGICEVMHFEVGIPRPDFLDGANYLGTMATEGFLCNVWEKVDFIYYYEDVVTRRPVRWDFYDGISTHVLTFEVGAVLQDSVTQAPAYCFDMQETKGEILESRF